MLRSEVAVRQPLSIKVRLWTALVLLALLLVACKGVLLPLPGLQPLDALRWLVRVFVVGSADVAFVLLLGLCLHAIVRLAQWLTPRWSGWSLVVAWTTVAAAALYGVASVAIFRHLEIQLTVPMLHFLGQWQEMASSVRSVVSWHTWLAVVAAMCGFVAAYRLAAWRLTRRPVRVSRPAKLCLVTLLVAYFTLSIVWSRTQWRDHSLWQARLAKSPHLRLIESMAAFAPLSRTSDLPPDAPEFDDFRPASRLVSLARPSMRRPKNIVLVVLESVGSRYLGLYGAPYDNTPNLERLSERAMVFDNIYSQCPSTSKAILALLSGVYARMDWRDQTRRGQLPVPSLADVAGKAGYRTAFFHPGDWRPFGKVEYLRDHGFQHIREARDLARKGRSWGQYDSWILDEMFGWIDRQPGPFLTVAWTIQTHHPYPVEKDERDYGVDDVEMNRYLNAVRESDELVGKIWQAIEERHLADSTLLVVIGDHGESFGHHNQRLHIFGLHEENVHVPLLIVHNDPQLPVGRSDTIGQQVDLPATLAECAGLPSSPLWQGRSLLASGRAPRAYFYVVWDPVLFGVRQGRYKYILEPGRGDAMYDLVTDPGEVRDVAAEHPELRQQLKRRLHALAAYRQPWQDGRDDVDRSGPANGRRLTASGKQLSEPAGAF